MIQVNYNESGILSIIEAPGNGVTHSIHCIFLGTIEDAELFFDMKGFNLDPVNEYKSNIKNQ
jgi:hypothetical protein